MKEPNNYVRVKGLRICATLTFNDCDPEDRARAQTWASNKVLEGTYRDEKGNLQRPRIVAWRPCGFHTHLVGRSELP
jgi:hypothetical protein